MFLQNVSYINIVQKYKIKTNKQTKQKQQALVLLAHR